MFIHIDTLAAILHVLLREYDTRRNSNAILTYADHIIMIIYAYICLYSLCIDLCACMGQSLTSDHMRQHIYVTSPSHRLATSVSSLYSCVYINCNMRYSI